MPPLRIGVLGCGRIVRLTHLRALQLHGDVNVVADPEPDARAYCARHAPGAVFFSDFRELIDQATLDAVVIALPTLLHRPAAALAFDRGLHVYLEKPIAATVPEGEAIVASWRRAGTVANIGFHCRFNALYREMQRAIDAGEIGAPVAVRSAWTAHWPSEATWRLSPSSGGGALLELASHHVDACRFLLSSEIDAVTATTWSNRGIDEASMMQLRLTNGVRAQILVCYGTVEEDRFEVYGREGKLILDRYNSLLVDRVPLKAAGGIANALRRASQEISRLSYGLEKLRAPGQEPAYTASLHSFVDAVRAGRQGAPSLDDGLASLRAIAAAHSSAASGDPQPG